MRGESFMTDSIDSLLAANSYDDYDDDSDLLLYDALEGVPLDEHFRSFSFHRVIGDNPFEYGQDACKEILWDK
jgi:hypothetical protein